MKVTVEMGPERFRVNGVDCSAWHGETENGKVITLLVAGVLLDPADAAVTELLGPNAFSSAGFVTLDMPANPS